ncbi:MAG: alpha/beta hydrolase [Chloroflexi bacterium]|nr:alpha/beta hydrolase [Chloroflexota bacterium]
MRTRVFKTIGDCRILADIYGPDDGQVRPAIVWLHGGALILGRRSNISQEQVDFYVGAGYRLIALDYRLAPETRLPEIVEDVSDGLAWVRQNADALAVDPHRLVVVGHSAGGYLTLMVGCRAQPRPRALVAFYGYGDILGEWYTRPSPFYCAQPRVARAAAHACVGTAPISEVADSADRIPFYIYCRQQGLWPKEVSGWDPEIEPARFAPFCPVCNVTADFPPTLLLHGDRDSDVPCEQSLMMAEALARAGVPHELVLMPGGEHGFDLRGFTEPATRHAFDRVGDFLKRMP